MKVICISGKAEHGKDTLANMIAEELRSNGKNVLITHYGDLLKYISIAFFKWNGQKDEAGRTLLQTVGSNVRQNISKDYWVHFIADMLDCFDGNWDYVLIPDCRYPNEYEILRDRGLDVKIIRVVRPSFRSHLTDEQMFHASETALDNYTFDYMFVNTTLDYLRSQAHMFLEEKYPSFEN